MEKLIPTLQVLNGLYDPVMFTITDDVIIISKRFNDIEVYEAAQDAIRDADILYVWRENSIIINPELL